MRVTVFEFKRDARSHVRFLDADGFAVGFLLGLAGLVASTGLARPTAHRLAVALEHRGASGSEPEEVEEHARAMMEEGFRYIRAQVAVTGYATYGVSMRKKDRHYAVAIDTKQDRWSPEAYVRRVPKLFDHLRSTLGEEVELLHDIHERVPPMYAIRLAKELEPYRLFFLEDPFAPEDNGWFPMLRQHSTTPIAMGELFVNKAEYMPLIHDQLIDFIRVHISDIGGLTPARSVVKALPPQYHR